MMKEECVLAVHQLNDCDEDMEIPEEFQPMHQNRLPFQNTSQLLPRNIPTDKSGSASKSKGKKKLTLGLQSYKDIKSAYLRQNSRPPLQSGHDKQCTFTPKINQNRGSRNRNFSEFIETQESFLKNKNNKIENMKTEFTDREHQLFTGTPKIDRRSRRISEESSSKKPNAVFERLSEVKNKKDCFEELNQSNFRPKILKKSKSLVRKGDVSALLYSDAQRRISQQKLAKAELSKQSRLDSSTYSKSQNHNTNKLVCKKIRTEFMELIEGEESGLISPILAITVISEIFNIDLNPNKDEQLCWKVVQFLVEEDKSQGDKVGYTPVDKFWDFIKAIIGVHEDSSYYSLQEQLLIQDKLGYFYSQRMTRFTTKLQQNDDESQYKIEASEHTNRLAENHRNKQLNKLCEFMSENAASNMLQGEEGNEQVKYLRLQDMFLLDSIRKRVQIEEKKLQKQKEEMKECSFRPSITSRKPLNGSYSKNRSSIDSKSRERSNAIKEEPFPINLAGVPIIEEEDCSQSIIHHQKILEDSSNRENINRGEVKQEKKGKKIVLKGGKPKTPIKNMDKAVLRLTIGRKIRQYENQQKERGYGQIQENWLSKKQKQKKRLQSDIENFKGYCSGAEL